MTVSELSVLNWMSTMVRNRRMAMISLRIVSPSMMVMSSGEHSFALKKEMEMEESEAIMAEQKASEFQTEK